MKDDYTNTGIAEPPAKDTGVPASVKSARRNGRNNGHESAKEVEEQKKQAGPPKSIWREYFESAVVTVIMALFGMTFIVQAVKVPTGSMQNTILVGDHLLVNKFIFAAGPSLPFLPQREIKRGDIIVFKYPGNKYEPERDREHKITAYSVNYVKRVIGLPGDRVEMRGETVYINGQPLPEQHIVAMEPNSEAPLKIVKTPPRRSNESYTVYYRPNETDGEGNFESAEAYPVFHFAGNGTEIVVPPNSYFVMGDNRDNSEDSRYWGFVRRELVVGRAMFVYWSYDESKPKDGNPLALFFKNTRWDRTGTMVK